MFPLIAEGGTVLIPALDKMTYLPAERRLTVAGLLGLSQVEKLVEQTLGAQQLDTWPAGVQPMPGLMQPATVGNIVGPGVGNRVGRDVFGDFPG